MLTIIIIIVIIIIVSIVASASTAAKAARPYSMLPLMSAVHCKSKHAADMGAACKGIHSVSVKRPSA